MKRRAIASTWDPRSSSMGRIMPGCGRSLGCRRNLTELGRGGQSHQQESAPTRPAQWVLDPTGKPRERHSSA